MRDDRAILLLIFLLCYLLSLLYFLIKLFYCVALSNIELRGLYLTLTIQ